MIFNLLRMTLIALIVFSSTNSLAAEDKIRTNISGYVEPQITATKDDILIKERLRLEIDIDFQHNISLVANADFFAYQGDRNWNMLDFVPEKINASVAAADKYLYESIFSEDILLHKAYLKASLSSIDLYLGRQQMPLGTGYAWNPTDIFNLKDTTDPTSELPGHDAIRIDYMISDRSNLYVFYLPDENADEFDTFKPEAGNEESAIVVRYKRGIGHFDTSLIFMRRDRLLTDYVSFETIAQKRSVYGFDLAGELFSLGVWAEYAYHALNNAKDFDDFVLGADYTFLNELYVLGEYYRNNAAKKDHKLYDIHDWMRFLFGETKTITRDQLYLYLSYPATDLITVGCAALTSLNDGSVQIIPSASYSMTENIEANLFLNFSLGDEETSFGESLGHSITARMRIFF